MQKQRLRRFGFSLVAFFSVVFTGASAQTTPEWSLAADLPSGAADLRITTFAANLTFPMGIAVLPDGSLLVGTSEYGRGNYFIAPGQLLRLTDSNDDGVADDAGTVLADGLPPAIVNVRQFGDFIFVTSASSGTEAITMLRKGADWSSPLTIIGSIDFVFVSALHQSYGLAVRAAPDDPQVIELYFNLGAAGNDAGGDIVGLYGLVEAQLADSAIYRILLTPDGESIAVSEPELIATGLRNAAAFDFDPISGDLIITDNGIDGSPDPTVSFSADEVNIIPVDQIGGSAEDFGFPGSYTDYAAGNVVGDNDPFATFGPISGDESEGVASLTAAPMNFPAGLNNGWFTGFHGQWNLVGEANEENPVLYVDRITGERLPFIRSDAPGIGHIDTLASTDDLLYLADLCQTAGLNMGQPCGVIYRIAVP